MPPTLFWQPLCHEQSTWDSQSRREGINRVASVTAILEPGPDLVHTHCHAWKASMALVGSCFLCFIFKCFTIIDRQPCTNREHDECEILAIRPNSLVIFTTAAVGMDILCSAISPLTTAGFTSLAQPAFFHLKTHDKVFPSVNILELHHSITPSLWCCQKVWSVSQEVPNCVKSL